MRSAGNVKGSAVYDLRVGDALDLLRSLNDDSVNLIATDPPYFKVKDEPWDHAWDSSSAFLDWVGEIVDECQRVLTPNGSLYLFASPQMAARVQGVVAQRMAVLNEIVWCKPTGYFQRSAKELQRAFRPQTERIIFAEQFNAEPSASRSPLHQVETSEPNAGIFEPIRQYLVEERDRAGFTNRMVDEVLGTNGMAGHYFTPSQWLLPTQTAYEQMQAAFQSKDPAALCRDFESIRNEYESTRRTFHLPADSPHTDVWTYRIVPPGRGGKVRHPCAKPVDMMEHIVATSTRPGDVVCDPFLGSGATAVAAHNLGRDFIGGDALPQWVEHTRDRLTTAADLTPSRN